MYSGIVMLALQTLNIVRPFNVAKSTVGLHVRYNLQLNCHREHRQQLPCDMPFPARKREVHVL